MANYKHEFPDFDSALYCPSGYRDHSYHNDIMPRAAKELKRDGYDIYISIWQDYKDTEKREYSENTKRYVFQIEVDGEIVKEYSTDSLADVKAYVKDEANLVNSAISKYKATMSENSKISCVVNKILEGADISSTLLAIKEQSFNKGDIVLAKDGFLDKGEKLEDTAGVVVSYNPDNDSLVIGTLHPEKYALPHTYSMRGEFYRLATKDEIRKFGFDMPAKIVEYVPDMTQRYPEGQYDSYDEPDIDEMDIDKMITLEDVVKAIKADGSYFNTINIYTSDGRKLLAKVYKLDDLKKCYSDKVVNWTWHDSTIAIYLGLFTPKHYNLPLYSVSESTDVHVIKADYENTGGGVNVYYGKLSNGQYFVFSEDAVMLCDADYGEVFTSEFFDRTDGDTYEWEQEHVTTVIALYPSKVPASEKSLVKTIITETFALLKKPVTKGFERYL